MFYIYILDDPDKKNKCKIGVTKNPKQRLRTFRVAAPNCNFYKLYTVPERRHEKNILSIFKDITTVHNELVSCSPEFATRVVDSYIGDLDF